MPNIVRFDCFEANLASGQLRKRGIRIALRDKSFQVLAALLEHPGDVVTREELQHRLWQGEVFVDFENNLNTAIARLRQALGDSAEHPRFVETLPRRGYRFLINVSEPPAPAEQNAVHRAKLAVLPFLNLSKNPGEEYFSDAMTDEIITALASLAPEQLAVIARTTAMHYKGSHKDLARIGRELSVDYVVEGGVRRAGGRIAINVQLIQISEQTHLFARRYEAEMRDVFSLQNSIAQAVARHIPCIAEKIGAGELAIDEQNRRKPTEDLVAYHLYLQARSQMYRETPDGFARAKEFFEQAIAHDPDFALAYDGLGELCWWTGFFGFAPPREIFSAGLWAALRALEIDNKLAETHALLGMFRKELDYNWPEVQREMERALELQPESSVVRFRYSASGLLPQGRIKESLVQLERALEYDPLSIFMHAWKAVLLWLRREFEPGLREAHMLADLAPDYYLAHFAVAQNCREMRMFPEAIAAQRRAVELSGGAQQMLGWLGLAMAQGGKETEARALLQELHDLSAQSYVSPTSFAWIHLGLGETDEAFVWLDRAIDGRDPMIVPIKTYPFLDPMRNDSRFASLLCKMNLEP